MRLTLAVHSQLYTIHSFTPETEIPASVFCQPVFFIGKTQEELSIVVPSELTLYSLEQEDDWRCLEILGPLGFSMTGIISRISGTLADAGISIFTISTFDTDYILVKKDTLDATKAALKQKQYQLINY
ncbi:MAG: ACT domain-containing protein [Shewanella sp.]|nr:ACT domain-containing protein [Shewanella sp.]MCF1431570.1 ACT domain-containing protein [Shewanella sp.]MCF1437878.1 ACT domain-containing protein [Shewanella sp.]MCF1456896.1 ACT domain-containing protein [Shewanella sp.]